jgi:hypothetical protein
VCQVNAYAASRWKLFSVPMIALSALVLVEYTASAFLSVLAISQFVEQTSYLNSSFVVLVTWAHVSLCRF